LEIEEAAGLPPRPVPQIAGETAQTAYILAT
jgi:hypothetical protein